MRVLIVEDEKRLAQALGQIMEEQHYQVDIVYDGADGLDYALSGQYDIVILDVMLPKKDGFEVVHELREQKISTPVLMLTARDDISDKVQGLDCGADDYMTKPFSPEELLARIRAALRRAGPAANLSAFTTGELTIDYDKHLVTLAGQPVHLTANEYRLVELLSRSAGKVLTYDRISEAMWDDAAGGNCCGSIWPISAASWSRTPPSRSISSPRSVWATA